MNVYVCDWRDEDGEFSVSFEAECWDTAQLMADRRGWKLVGQYMDEVPPEVDAMIEFQITDPAVH